MLQWSATPTTLRSSTLPSTVFSAPWGGKEGSKARLLKEEMGLEWEDGKTDGIHHASVNAKDRRKARRGEHLGNAKNKKTTCDRHQGATRDS